MAKPRHRLDSPLPWLAVALTVLVAALTWLRNAGHLQFLELAAYDVLVATATRPGGLKPPITLIDITEADIQRMGNWPLTDLQLAEALRRILDAEPRVVGVDIYRDLPVATRTPSAAELLLGSGLAHWLEPSAQRGHAVLERLLLGDSRIVVIEKFPSADSPGIPAPPVLAGSDRVGFSDLVSDPGAIIRRNLLFQFAGERLGHSLGLRLALSYLAAEGIYAEAGESGFMRLGDVTLIPLTGNEGGYVDADAGGYQIMLDYIGGADPFVHHSLGEVLTGAVGTEQLADRIVILGVVADSVKDIFAVPHAVLGGAQREVPGNTLHAHAARQLLEAAKQGRRPLRTWSDALELAWTIAWAVLGILAGWLAGTATRLGATVALGILLLVVVVAAAFHHGWWLPLIPPVFGWVGAAGLGTGLLAGRRRREQQALMEVFSCQVSPQIAKTIWDHRDEVLEGGRIRSQVLTVTMLFTDIQGFTKVSSAMEPEPFLDWLNSYMAAMTDTILRFGGFLDDFAGDGIKANFGVPIRHDSAEQRAEDARNAVRCAHALGDELTRLNRHWQDRGRPPVAMRIGIHSGPVVVGTVGSSTRMKYTTVGSNVNLAARLESLREVDDPDPAEETANCRVLVSTPIAELVADQFQVESLGRFHLKGIGQPTEVYSVRRPDTPPVPGA
jgi:adenylate cyclase